MPTNVMFHLRLKSTRKLSFYLRLFIFTSFAVTSACSFLQFAFDAAKSTAPRSVLTRGLYWAFLLKWSQHGGADWNTRASVLFKARTIGCSIQSFFEISGLDAMLDWLKHSTSISCIKPRDNVGSCGSETCHRYVCWRWSICQAWVLLLLFFPEVSEVLLIFSSYYRQMSLELLIRTSESCLVVCFLRNKRCNSPWRKNSIMQR